MSSEKDNDSEDSVHVEWSAQVEDILAAEGEKCRGLSWIHTRCETEMSRYNTFIQVPVIVLSTLAGTASVGSATLFAGQTTVSSIVIGLVSISVGIMNTLGGFFNFAKRAESHRIAHLHYSKIATKISIELSLPRLERISAESLLNYVRESMERLAETTPLAPEKILENFNKEFKDLKNEIAMPPETNGLHKIKVYRSNGPVPTPIAFTLDKMEQGVSQAWAGTGFGSVGSTSDASQLKDLQTKITELSSLKDSSEATTRRLIEEAQRRASEELQQSKEASRIAVESAERLRREALEASALSSEQAQKTMEKLQAQWTKKQEELELQLKSMEMTLLPITQGFEETEKHTSSGSSAAPDSVPDVPVLTEAPHEIFLQEVPKEVGASNAGEGDESVSTSSAVSQTITDELVVTEEKVEDK
jgi:hypothetical protein